MEKQLTEKSHEVVGYMIAAALIFFLFFGVIF